MQDKFEDLRTFVAVVHARSFAAAARRLGVVKSAVSRRVVELEERLGAHLLNRSTRTLSLTETGRLFYERATELLAGLEEAEGMAATGAAEPAGTLRVLGPLTFGRMHLVSLASEFLEQHPQLSIELSLSDDYVDLVAGGYDMAVRIGDLQDSSLVAQRLGDIRRVAIASPAYVKRFGEPREPKDLAHHRGIGYSVVEDKRFWRFVDPRTGKVEVPRIRSRLVLNTGDALCAAAVAGAGVTVLPTFMVHRQVVSGELVVLMLPWEKAPTAAHVVYPTRKLAPAKVKAFVAFIAARCGPYPQWDRDVFGSAPTPMPG